MKKISICLLSGLLLLSSCLDEDPKYTTNEEVVFSSEASAQMSLNGIYGLMAIQGSFAQLLPEIATEASGICWTTDKDSDIRSLYVKGNISLDNEFNDRAWGALYQTISNCNIFIDACNGERSSDWPTKANMVAQAKFIRGVCYYYLYTFWGSVPLRVEPTNTENIEIPRASRQQIINQMITDWTEAADDLYDKTGLESSKPTAPCKASAWAYLAKLYWLMGCNAQAVENGDPWGEVLRSEWPEMGASRDYFLEAQRYGNMVFSANVFDLEPDYYSLFGGNRLADSKEFVFVVSATMNTTENVGYNSLHWTFSPQSCSPGESWGRAQPNKAFYNWARGTYQDDPRLSLNFVSQWYRFRDGAQSTERQVAYPLVQRNDTTWKTVDSVLVPGLPPVEVTVVDKVEQAIVGQINYEIPSTNAPGDYSNAQFADVRNPLPSEILAGRTRGDTLVYESYCRTKQPDSWNINDWAYFGKYMTMNCSGRYSDNNLYVYRYADFLLLMADVENEVGSMTKAEKYVNDVLDRARNSTRRDGTKGATYPKRVSGLSQEDMRDYIFWERLFELVAEYDGFTDTRRRGVEWHKKVYMKNNNDSITAVCHQYGLDHGYTGMWHEYWYPNDIKNASDGQWNQWLIKNQLNPIPRVEFTTNGAITNQNWGY